ncbi:hypothetical protein AEQU3_03226 [Aequorivita antarctica]|nr:hypothetical protein AEQU3_03226 [Aequorivita antarctica]
MASLYFMTSSLGMFHWRILIPSVDFSSSKEKFLSVKALDKDVFPTLPSPTIINLTSYK